MPKKRPAPEEATKRAAVERDPFRLTVALAASVLGLIALGGGGWAYFAQQRAARQAATERVVTEALDKATLLRGQAKAAPVGDLSKWSDGPRRRESGAFLAGCGRALQAFRGRVVQLLATLEKEQAAAAHRATGGRSRPQVP